MKSIFTRGSKLILYPMGERRDGTLASSYSIAKGLMTEEVEFVKFCDNHGNALVIDADGRRRYCNPEHLSLLP